MQTAAMPNAYEIEQAQRKNEQRAELQMQIAILDFARDTGQPFARNDVATWTPEQSQQFVTWLSANRVEVIQELIGMAVASQVLSGLGQQISDDKQRARLEARLSSL